MRSGTQLLGSFAVLLALQVLTALVAIAMLGRMSPAIERILTENVYSVRAVEEMLGVLAHPAPSEVQTRAYLDALGRAESNVTEEEERPELERLRRLAGSALAGDVAARTESVEALLALGRINRDAMVRADEEAKRLGTAGAWAAALLGFLGVGASLIAIARSRKRFIAPVAEIARTVADQESGDLHRRAIAPDSSAAEIVQVTRFLNELLDYREHTAQAIPVTASVERNVALHFLDRLDEPVAVVDAFGELVAANHSGQELLAGPKGPEVRDSLRRARLVATGESLPGVLRRETLGETGATLLVLEPAS